MAPKSAVKGQALEAKLVKQPNERTKGSQEKPTDYSSHGVTDNDIFLLPSSDYQLLGILTVVAAVVRIFRIYQPRRLVFDELKSRIRD